MLSPGHRSDRRRLRSGSPYRAATRFTSGAHRLAVSVVWSVTVPRKPNVPVCQQRSRNWPTMRIGYINVSPGQIWQLEPVEPSGASRPVVVRSQIVTNNDEWMREAAIAGLGISVLPVFIVARALASSQLINALCRMYARLRMPSPPSIRATAIFRRKSVSSLTTWLRCSRESHPGSGN